MNREGRPQLLLQTAQRFAHPRLSPDGSRVAVRKAGFNCDLWILDLNRGTSTRFTFEGDNHAPVWAPDGQTIFYSSYRVSEILLLRKRTDGSTDPRHPWSPRLSHRYSDPPST
jgi:Tol biopolymer transport system component